VRCFTIGFGRPTDVDHPLLEKIAEMTAPWDYGSSQFYDVTVPGFEALDWNPANALQDVYKAILVDALGLESAVDPIGIINMDEVVTHPVMINEHDRKVSFYLSWATPGAERLGLTVRSSDGEPVPTAETETGVRYHQGETYKIITVDKNFLEQPGKVTSTPWRMEIAAVDLEGQRQEGYQYSVIMKSALKMEANFDNQAYGAGDKIMLAARLTEAGQPLIGLKDVGVDITAPEEGAGNWLVQNPVTSGELDMVPASIGNETINLRQRLGQYLLDVRQIDFPAVKDAIRLFMYDDGTHGDEEANDGVYTTIFNGANKEGTYSFSFHASGQTSGGLRFQRQKVAQKYLPVRPSPPDIQIDIMKIDPTVDLIRQYHFKVIPMDHLGNFVGPGRARGVRLQSSHGSFAGTMTDNLDGSYAQVLQLPEGVDVDEVEITLGVGETEAAFNLGEKLARRGGLGVSIYAGAAIPTGNLNNLYDPDLMVAVDLEYGFKPDWSALALLGHNRFSSGDPSVEDTYWWNISANLKRVLPTVPLQPYVNAGGGFYLPEDGDTEFGLNVGVGRDQPIGPTLILETGLDYHRIFISGGDASFITAHVGLIHRF
jgi:hypothetical protein